MLQDPQRTLGFFCPKCRQAVVIERSAFQLAAAQSSLPCPCGKSALEIEILGDKVRLSVPCVFCEKTHTVTCSTHGFLHEKAMALSCSASGLDCCYVGEEGPVFAAMERLEEAIDALEVEAAGKGAFFSEMVMEEILEELRDIGARGAIDCSCGSKTWGLQVNYSSVYVLCRECGGAMRIPAATLTDLDDLCCKPTLTIRGKK